MASAVKNEHAPGGRVLLRVSFAVYLVLLAWIILWKLEVPWIGEAALLPRPIKLIPFLPSAEADSSDPFEVLANVLLFVPFGLYLGLLAPSWRWWQSAAVFAGASLALEVTQHLISIGSFDITDVIVNTAGGLTGVGLVVLAQRRSHGRAAVLLRRICVIGTAALVLAVGLFIASPLHYGPQQDVVLPTPTP